MSTLGRIRRKGSAPDAYSFAMAMTACARAGEPRQALRLLDELKREGGGVRPNTVVYNTLLGLCKGKPLGSGGGGGGRGGGGGTVAATAVEGNGANLNGYSGGGDGINGGGVAINSSDVAGALPVPEGGSSVVGGAGVGRPKAPRLSGSGEWGEQAEELVGTAVSLLHEMTVGGGECAPDKMSFELVMQACVNAGRPESALKVFRAMTRWASGGEGRGRGGRRRAPGGVLPDRATYRLGLTAAAEAGDGAAAAVLLEEMRDAGMLMDEVCVCSWCGRVLRRFCDGTDIV